MDNKDRQILHSVYRKLQTQIEYDQKKIEKFAIDFLKNPASTLEWADDIFLISVRHRCYCKVDGLLSKKDYALDMERLKERKKYVQREVLRMATLSERSTSVCSNLAKREELVVFADMLDPIDGLLSEIE